MREPQQRLGIYGSHDINANGGEGAFTEAMRISNSSYLVWLDKSIITPERFLFPTTFVIKIRGAERYFRGDLIGVQRATDLDRSSLKAELSHRPKGWWGVDRLSSLDFESILYISCLKEVSRPPELGDKASPERPHYVEFDVELPVAASVDTEPKPSSRIKEVISRIARDTELANYVKRRHNFECQICGQTIELPNGERYAESHHIRPLGYPHNGPDVIGNILCVCPNFHVKLDCRAIPLSLPTVHRSDVHPIDRKHIDYHNSLVKQKK